MIKYLILLKPLVIKSGFVAKFGKKIPWNLQKTYAFSQKSLVKKMQFSLREKS